MEDLLKKISEYQLFNFLLSGTVLAFLITKTTPLNLLNDNILVAVFIYYFMGLVVSRMGSLVIEPLYKKLRIVKYAPYKQYLKAVKLDSKIDILSQENNTYRTLVAMFLVYALVYIFCWLWPEVLEQEWLPLAIAGMGVILFSLSYRKQTKYIAARVNQHK
ncbi:hypothetical protein JNM87_00915 [Candidatus Saccharibacteria bacterium]|nr:hypothetical protein [Candidatus Saccharibacteria bacterium]